MNFFTQNGNNAGIITFTINSSSLGEWRPAFRISRREQVTISRYHIVDTRLTHYFILEQEQQTQCLKCQTPYTVKHTLVECRAFALIRKRFFKVNSLSDLLFEDVNMDDVLSFLREIGLYQIIWGILLKDNSNLFLRWLPNLWM